MTPNDIEVLIHCHTTQKRHPRMGAPAVDGAIAMLCNAGLIIITDGQNYYNTTKRGKAHIKQLCYLDIPVQAWKGADGQIIDISE